MPNSRYYDIYSFSVDNFSRVRSKLGDGVKEIYNGSQGWCEQLSNFTSVDDPWLHRGGIYYSSSSAGLFFSNHFNGSVGSGGGTRFIIIP